MVRFFAVLATLLIMGCSTHQHVVDTPLSRTPSSDVSSDISNATAFQRLEMLKKHIDSIMETIKVQGNPRFYLYENFQERTAKILDNMLEKNDPAMNEKTFIPDQVAVAAFFNQFVHAYLVLEKAEKYLEEDSVFIPEESEDTKANIANFHAAMDHYRVALDQTFQKGVLNLDARLKREAREHRDLLKYLAGRVEMYYENFVTNSNHKKRVQAMINHVRQLSGKTPSHLQQSIKSLKKKWYWKRSHKYLDNLSLPDSSDINGSDDSFEQVMSVQMSANLLQKLVDMKINLLPERG